MIDAGHSVGIRAGLAAMLVCALLSIANIAALHFGPLRSEAIAVDELYFAACAARGSSVGEYPVAGCHDNKAPLIFAVHQLVQALSAPYQLDAIKIAAYAVAGLVSLLVAALACRLGGAGAALAAAALWLGALATDPTHLALKTETVSSLWILLGLFVLLDARSASSSAARWLAGGLGFGLAVTTKQTHLLPALVAWAWVAWLRPAQSVDRRGAMAFALGLFLPFAVFVAVFAAGGRMAEIVSSFFVYPMVYATNGTHGKLQHLAWTLGDLLSMLWRTPLLVLLGVFAVAEQAHRVLTRAPTVGADVAQRGLLVAVGVALLVAILAAPKFFAFHLVPLRAVMAVLGGLLLAKAAAWASGAAGSLRWGVAAALWANAILMGASSWFVQARGDPPEKFEAADGEIRPGQRAYVLGMWPEFYSRAGLLPSSGVMFPWALERAPPNAFFAIPPPGSLRSELLAWARQQGTQALRDDFAATPPQWIVIVDAMARSSDSTRVTDVRAIEDHLHARCHEKRRLVSPRQEQATLYQCLSR